MNATMRSVYNHMLAQAEKHRKDYLAMFTGKATPGHLFSHRAGGVLPSGERIVIEVVETESTPRVSAWGNRDREAVEAILDAITPDQDLDCRVGEISGRFSHDADLCWWSVGSWIKP
jgi:hypothetical protein